MSSFNFVKEGVCWDLVLIQASWKPDTGAEISPHLHKISISVNQFNARKQVQSQDTNYSKFRKVNIVLNCKH